MSKKMLAVALAAMLVAASASSADMRKDPYAGVTPCPDSASYEYVGGTLFDFDKSVPATVEMSALGSGYAKAVGQFRGHNYIWIHVKGGTDSVGSDAYNDKLGLRRVRAVKRAMASQGVDSGLVHIKSFGKRWPKYDNATAEGRHMNRAAHVSIVSMDQEKADWCYAVHPESVPKGHWWMLP